VDPLGGSFFVEALTDQMEQQAYDYFRRVEELAESFPPSKRDSSKAKFQTRLTAISVRLIRVCGKSSA